MTYLEKSLILRCIRETTEIADLLKVYDVLPYNIRDKDDAEVWEAYRNKLNEYYGDFKPKVDKK